jgi:hypothetical protein
MAEIRIYEEPERFGVEDEYGYEEEYGVDFAIEQFLEELEFDPDALSMASYITLPPDPRFRRTSKNQIFTIENTTSSTLQIRGFLAAHFQHNIPAGGGPDSLIVYVGGERYDHGAIVRELELNPVLVSGIQISGEPATLQKFALGISTRTIWGASSTNVAVASAYRTPKDFDRSLIELPISFILNGRTGLDFSIPANESISFIIFVSRTQPNDALLRRRVARGNVSTMPVRPGVRPRPGTATRSGVVRPGTSLGGRGK